MYLARQRPWPLGFVRHRAVGGVSPRWSLIPTRGTELRAVDMVCVVVRYTPMTVKEAAALLCVSTSFTYELVKKGEIAFEWRGKRKLLVDASVAEYRQRNLVPANPVRQKPVTGPGYQFRHLNGGRAAEG